jgi:hypothetical protein
MEYPIQQKHHPKKRHIFVGFLLWGVGGVMLYLFIAGVPVYTFALQYLPISQNHVMAHVGNESILHTPDISDTTFVTPSNIIFNPDPFLHGSWGNGITMFRGNLTRTWYGDSKLPSDPRVLWRYPENPMCADSTDKGITKKWCGTGWTGQPVVYVQENVTEIIFGAYDKHVHFVDAETGMATRPSFETGDIIKGSVTLDPDGFPLIYFGSRDNKLRIVSLQENTPKELWSLDSADLPGIWNDDWDSNPAIVDDVMYVGGENGWFFAIQLNRKKDTMGNVTVDPEILFTTPSYDDELIAQVGRNVSIESSVAIYNNVVYFSNSGGRIMGFSMDDIKTGNAEPVFDYWVGDDTDATIVIDEQGYLYVAIEEKRLNERSKEIGQLVKLDPRKKNPLIWNVHIPSVQKGVMGGVWATPALYKNYLYVPTNPGELLVVDTDTGNIVWRDTIGWHAWSSPIISRGEMMVATCNGSFRKYNLDNPAKPVLMYTYRIPSGNCIESTPALWDGKLYVGSRDGYFYKIGDKQYE